MARETVQYVVPTDLDDIPDGTTYKKMSATEQSKLSGIETGATADQTGTEMQTAILGLSDSVRKIVASEPTSGKKKVYGLVVNASGNIELDQNTTAEP